ncbi:solute carrier family 23 member 3 isoform X1 [Danio rerio]|uniref:Solute carrier family 23 member 3 isoform X1 n=2 Tax=Danio rerio TaxID=7955 RepID=A0A8M6Z2M6_DANRE|nr:solute carrier family 23 member 3 isoform X1 [Danio rerio]|eukprot:XP_017213243.2 solute carrier family 23 member 3 isoform X1 [Danio rerio]
MVQTDRCKRPLDLEKPEGNGSLDVDCRPSILLNFALALQHVLVLSSLCALVVCTLIQEVERDTIVAYVLFHSGISTLLQSWIGSRLPLIQAPSLDFLIPAMALLSDQSGSAVSCRGQCVEPQEPVAPANPIRELRGMVVVAGVVQLAAGSTGLGGFALGRCGPLVLAPLLCILGFSIYKEAALLCSDHWGLAILAVVLLVILSQHLHSFLHLSVLSVCRRLSVLLSVMVTWVVCAALSHWGHVHLNSVTEMISINTNATFNQYQNSPQSIHKLIIHNGSLPWLDFPLPASSLPLLSGRSVAAGLAGGLSASMSSPAVYVLCARLLKAPVPPAHACNRGLCVDGLGSVFAGLMGAPVGLCSSASNACVIGLSQSGSRSTVQLAGVSLLILGLSPQLAQMLCSVPLAIHGAVLSVTYALAVATGITYFQHADVDSGRNIFNIGFTMFMSLALPHWFRLHSGFIQTGVGSVDVFLQSLLTLPVFLVGVLAFLLEHTVSGTLPERGLVRQEGTKKIQSFADQQQGYSHSPDPVYDPPAPVMKVLNLTGFRTVLFCACRTHTVEEVLVTEPEMSSLLPDKDTGACNG